MKIIAISDTHTYHRQIILPEGDVLIHAGDFSSTGLKHECEDFFEWFASQPHKHKILIAGNHDISFDARKNKVELKKPEWVLELLEKYSDINYLENSEIEIEGIKFLGSPYTPDFYPEYWGFNEGNNGRKALYQNIPEDVDILITHGPAYSYMDNIQSVGGVGCYHLRHAIHDLKPKYHLFGHIHTDATYNPNKHFSNGSTVFLNVSICNTQNKVSWEPTILQLERSTIF